MSGMSQQFSVLVSSKSDEYYTPPEYIESARRVLGQIDLDPASCAEANEVVQAYNYYDTYGLEKFWYRNVWLNPPFSETVKWVNKLEHEYTEGRVDQAILLCKSAMGYNWFEDLWRKHPTCLARRRIQFIGGPGQAKQGTAFVYFGHDISQVWKFVSEFQQYGRIIPPEAGWT